MHPEHKFSCTRTLDVHAMSADELKIQFIIHFSLIISNFMKYLEILSQAIELIEFILRNFNN